MLDDFDTNLRRGDSLVGLDGEQLASFGWTRRAPVPALHDALVQGCDRFVSELLDEFGQK